MPTKGVLFWARQALKVNKANKMKSQQTCLAYEYAMNARPRWCPGSDRIVNMFGGGVSVKDSMGGWDTELSHFLPSRSNRGITWLDCLPSRHRTRDMVYGVWSMVYGIWNMAGCWSTVWRINMKRFWARSNTYGPSVSHPGIGHRIGYITTISRTSTPRTTANDNDEHNEYGVLCGRCCCCCWCCVGVVAYDSITKMPEELVLELMMMMMMYHAWSINSVFKCTSESAEPAGPPSRVILFVGFSLSTFFPSYSFCFCSLQFLFSFYLSLHFI